nr:MAG TPA: hypothetical protein [Caudoviricetes sp.]
MAYDIPKFLRRDGDSLLFDQEGEFVFYVPEIYFDAGRKDAVINGEYVNLLGILDYAIFSPTGYSSGPKRFFFPTVFLTRPSRIEKQKNVKLKPGVDPQDYRLLIYNKDDPVVVSTKVPQDIANVESFYRIFLYGKLPVTIPYDKMQDYFTESIALNGSSYSITLQMFGFVIGEICRSKTNLNIPFRLTDFTDLTSYKPLGIRDVPKYISPNSSIGSENWDNAVVGAIMHPNDVGSPMEKLIMGSSGQ